MEAETTEQTGGVAPNVRSVRFCRQPSPRFAVDVLLGAETTD
jgi:hypothetical protein